MVLTPARMAYLKESIQDICKLIDNGGLVYMDSANMKCQVGLTSPGRIGADIPPQPA